ncbi:MAG: MBL fold metallo-hydrolase [Proteobacteria bacterium]|nr:MBL fold metallo-hydrolase [Pseudomonadota bacterium]
MIIQQWFVWALVVSAIGMTGTNGVMAQSLFDMADDITTVRIESHGQNFSPRQSITPGAAPRHTSDFDLTVVWQPGDLKAREEWVLRTHYPVSTELSYSMTYHQAAGVTEGQDSLAPGSDARPMGGRRIGANLKTLWLTNPLILAAHAESISAPESIGVEGSRERVTFVAFDTNWSMVFDSSNGLPLELATTEADQHQGEIEHRVTFQDWREVSGVPFPYRVEQFLEDKLLRREVRSAIMVNPEISAGLLELPDSLQDTDQSLRQQGWSMSHFSQARAGLGIPQDYFETHSISFHEVGQDLYQVRGSEGDNNLLVVGPDGLAIVDAPWFDQRSEEVLGALQERWPELPLKYVILMHHHIDHSGGFRAYVRAGATLVTSQGSTAFFANALAQAGHEPTATIAVGQSAQLDGIGRRIEVYDIANSHADATLIAYVPDEKLAFATDLFSPGRPRQTGPWVSELLESVRFHGIDVEQFVGGHGVGAGYPDSE